MLAVIECRHSKRRLAASLDQALALIILYAEDSDPRLSGPWRGGLGRLFLEQPMAFALAARCVELVGELRGPEGERAVDGLAALVRVS